jgi:RNA polymerase sigma-70 factor (ECF subfamily)
MDNVDSIPGTAGVERERALEVVMAEHESALLRYAARILRDPNVAQDVVQDVFIKLYQGWRNGAQPARTIKSWLFRVTHNTAIDHIRKESRLRGLHERQAEEVNPVQAPQQTIDVANREAMQLALQQIEKLEASEQQVVVLRLQEGMSYREIAEITNRSEGNVGCILHNAMKKLAAGLKRAGVTLGGD